MGEFLFFGLCAFTGATSFVRYVISVAFGKCMWFLVVYTMLVELCLAV